jgi:hypothetical protein
MNKPLESEIFEIFSGILAGNFGGKFKYSNSNLVRTSDLDRRAGLSGSSSV